MKDLVQKQNAGYTSTDTTANCVAKMNSLTKQLDELKNMDDGSELTKKSIALTENALRNLQARCDELLEAETSNTAPSS